MPRASDILQSLEQIAPSRFAFDFDKVGLQVGDPHQEILRAVVSLDRSLGAVRFAKQIDAQLLLTHHPLIFSPLATVDTRSHVGKTIVELIQNNISLIAAHTNWDSAKGGINYTLANLLGLRNIKDFGSGAKIDQRKLVFFCPLENMDSVVDAVSEAGAGVIGAYTRCAFMHPGTGTFLGGPESQPTIGTAGQIEKVSEARVEMVLRADQVRAVVKALKKSHPYDQPAYDILVGSPTTEQPAGRFGEIDPLSFASFVETVGRQLDVKAWGWGNPQKLVKKVAVVGGSADGEWINAQRAGADVLVTGEVKQHVALEAAESGFLLVAAGHYQTEHPGCEALRMRMQEAQPEIEWHLYTPEAGFAGRPL